jgi:hypothetical protein
MRKTPALVQVWASQRLADGRDRMEADRLIGWHLVEQWLASPAHPLAARQSGVGRCHPGEQPVASGVD